MTPAAAIVPFALLAFAAMPWLVRRFVRDRERSDGAPSLALIRASSLLNAVVAAGFVVAAVVSHGRVAVLAYPWRHDIWSALLLGALAGLLMHVLGSGSPLPMASLSRSRWPANPVGRQAGLRSVALFLAGETGTLFIWFGVGLPSLLRLFPRLLALPLSAAGYGLGRGASGLDHPLTGAIDGLLLGLLYLLTGSFVAVLIAHFLVDILAYVSAANSAEETAMELEAEQPLPSPSRSGNPL
jgi:hypothetical protein